MMDDQLNSFMESHLNGGYGDILDEQAADEFAEEFDNEYPFDEPWDEMLAQQELEDFADDNYFEQYEIDEF